MYPRLNSVEDIVIDLRLNLEMCEFENHHMVFVDWQKVLHPPRNDIAMDTRIWTSLNHTKGEMIEITPATDSSTSDDSISTS